MMLTLRDARKLCGPVAQAGGACLSAPLIDDRINEAVRRLARMEDVPEMTAIMHVLAQGNTLTLPREVKSARVINVNLSPVRVRHIGYEFSTSGPGEEAECECGSVSIIAEPGFFPTFFDLPKGRSLSIGAFVRSRESTASEMRIMGRLPNGEELMDTSARRGENLWISPWKDQLEGHIDARNSRFSTPIDQIEQIVLPTRQHYLTLLGMDLNTNETYFLAKYHPEETNPGFRRYRIRGVTCDEEHCVSLVVKLFPPTVIYPEDILPVQNVDAIKQMIMGIKEENARNLNEAQLYFAMAKRMLVEEMRDVNGGQEVMLPLRDDYGYGGGNLSL